MILVFTHNETGQPACCLCGYWTERLREAEEKLEQAKSPKVREAYQRLVNYYSSLRSSCHSVRCCAPSNDT